jgi:macrodomain Ter protein organizer (MatP/YcbG family)
MLNAEPIPKDTIIFQKLENLKNKMGTQMEDISTTLEENQTEICALKEEICAMKADMATLLNWYKEEHYCWI